MSFDQSDFGEDLLGKSVKNMSGDDLLPYAVAMHKEYLGFRLIIDPVKDRAVMRWLKKTYGEEAGEMVKWMFFQHGGKLDNGETFTTTWFNSNHKWWIDQIYSEMVRSKPQPLKIKSSRPIGFMGADTFLKLAASV